ncbi:hypothetical protein CEXT_711921, partial [Caerostris extrusa]
MKKKAAVIISLSVREHFQIAIFQLVARDEPSSDTGKLILPLPHSRAQQ